MSSGVSASNCCQVTPISFARIRGSKLTPVAQHDGIYFDQLNDIITMETGLALRLGKVIFA